MPQFLLNDEFWSKLKKILLQEAIYNNHNLLLTGGGMLYRMRVDCSWRNLPKAFGCWNSRWIQCLIIEQKIASIFKALLTDPDWKWEFIDGSYIKEHQHSAGATGQESQAEGQKPWS